MTLLPGDPSNDAAKGALDASRKPLEKHANQEAFLETLNRTLAATHDREYRDLPETYPTLHIVGVPRSGTTLLSQLISMHLQVGYIDNLIAAFWQAPLYGIRLSQKLLSEGTGSDFKSRYGRTLGIREPHEFGYFWRSVLGYHDLSEQESSHERRIDWNRLRTILVNMTHEFAAPVVFKSFLIGWHIRRLQRLLPLTCFVHLRRDPLESAVSLCAMRRQLGDPATTWTSLKPREYAWLKDEPLPRQLAGQVYFLDRRLTEQLSGVPAARVLEISYTDLCADPSQVLAQVQDLLARADAPVVRVGRPPPCFPYSAGPDIPEHDRDGLRREIDGFYREAA